MSEPEACQDCNLHQCKFKHVECRLSGDERKEIEWDLDDAVYHRSVDREQEERER